MELKGDNVRPDNQAGLMIAILAAQTVYQEYGIDLIITSMTDGVHSKTSLHYSGQAFDIRTRNIPNVIGASTIAKEIKDRLNKHYDVILEPTHIHIEFQPRR